MTLAFPFGKIFRGEKVYTSSMPFICWDAFHRMPGRKDRVYYDPGSLGESASFISVRKNDIKI